MLLVGCVRRVRAIQHCLGVGGSFVDEEGICWNTKEKVCILTKRQSVSRHFVADCRFGVVFELYYCTGGAEHQTL